MKEQNQALKYVLSVVFLIWFFASLMVLVVYGNRHDGAMVAIMFGQYFIVFGLILLFATISEKKFNPIALIPILVGAAVLGFGLCFRFGSRAQVVCAKELVPYAGLSVFVLIGCGLLYGCYYNLVIVRNRCDLETSAKCVEVRSSYSDGSTTYCPVYELYYRGETKTLCNNVYTSPCRVNVGDVRTIFINPEKPEDYYEPSANKTVAIVLFIIGSMFTVVGIIGLIALSR